MFSIQIKQNIEKEEIPAIVGENTACNLGSLYYSQPFTNLWLEGKLTEQTEHVILFGGGSGHIAEKLAEEILGEILLVEPEKAIYDGMRQSKCYKKLHYNKRITWAYGEQLWQIAEQWVRRVFNEDNVENTLFLCHPGYANFYAKEIISIHSICEKVCDEIGLMKGPIKRFIHAMIENQIRNIIYMKDGILVGRCKRYWNKKLPVILVSAGPSLEKNVACLKETEGKALIMAADAAVPTLLKNDVRPDLVACTDAMKNMTWFEDERCKDIPVLVTTNTPTMLFEKHSGIRLWGYDHSFVRLIFEKQKLPIPSVPFYSGVSTALFSTLIELGTETIIFVGQDLSYSEEGKSHVSGRDEGFVRDENYLLEGYYGEKVYSRGDWALFHDWFERMIAAFPERKVINATEGGAKIKGTIQTSLKQVIDELSTVRKTEDVFCCGKSALTSDEYESLMEEYNRCRDLIFQLPKISYKEAFYSGNYVENPAMQLVIDYMKSLDLDKREERYKEAVSYVKQVWENVEKEREV